MTESRHDMSSHNTSSHNTSSRDTRGVIAQGWTLMFITAMALVLVEIIPHAGGDAIARWSVDPGMPGVMLTLTMTGYALMPMLVRSLSAQWFRWVVLGVSVFFTVLFIGHQIGDLVRNVKPFGIVQILDFYHHVLGIWVSLAALKWVRQGQQERRPASVNLGGAVRSGLPGT